MTKETESGFGQEIGKGAIFTGIVAGLIGLVSNPELIIGGIVLLFGGLYLQKNNHAT